MTPCAPRSTRHSSLERTTHASRLFAEDDSLRGTCDMVLFARLRFDLQHQPRRQDVHRYYAGPASDLCRQLRQHRIELQLSIPECVRCPAQRDGSRSCATASANGSSTPPTAGFASKIVATATDFSLRPTSLVCRSAASFPRRTWWSSGTAPASPRRITTRPRCAADQAMPRTTVFASWVSSGRSSRRRRHYQPFRQALRQLPVGQWPTATSTRSVVACAPRCRCDF